MINDFFFGRRDEMQRDPPSRIYFAIRRAFFARFLSNHASLATDTGEKKSAGRRSRTSRGPDVRDCRLTLQVRLPPPPPSSRLLPPKKHRKKLLFISRDDAPGHKPDKKKIVANTALPQERSRSPGSRIGLAELPPPPQPPCRRPRTRTPPGPPPPQLD